MAGRRTVRWVLEALFLVALAAVLAAADATPLLIGLAMLAGWVLVVLFERAALRDRPHFGSGLPPRFYVPQVALPPARPLEQLPVGYPSGKTGDDEPTWIAPASMRDDVLGGWPVAGAAPPPGEETAVGASPARAEQPEETDPWLDAELVARIDPVDAPPLELEAAPAAESGEPAPVEDEPIGEETEPEEFREEELEVAAEPEPGERRARYRFDPLRVAAGGPPARQLPWRRRPADEATFVEVPDRPETDSALPGRAKRDN